ncbi:MAG: glycerol-3-phosphate dehydrogenase/oxidase [Acidimicrobiales bacterium]
MTIGVEIHQGRSRDLWQAEAVSPGRTAGSAGSATAGFRREEALERLGNEQFDVLVIGGGITGSGVALDAASRGLSTALVERHDFASGTSSKSSKMVHGGLRYLQQRDFRLVYEALHERQILLQNAPHLVAPLPFLIPLFGRDGVVNKTVARTYSTALWLYDITGGLRIGKKHKRISKSEALSHIPTLNADRLVAAFIYYDARADDARLTLSVARTAAVNYRAAVANYAEVRGLARNAGGNRVTGANVRAWTPENGVGSFTDIEVKATVVINATGVWADDVRALDEKTHPHSLKPAKGIHVTVPRSRLPADVAAVIPVRQDRRSIFVVPWPDGDDVYLGTTDTAWDGSLDDPACTPDDVDYLLDAANAVTTSALGRSDVTGLWAGLRPLLAPADRHVSERTADLSRRHTVHTSDDGVVTVTGGKLTTYRLMAEQTVDQAAKLLPNATPGSRTKRLKIIGAPASGNDISQLAGPGADKRYGLDADTLAALVRRHGTETPSVLELSTSGDGLLEPLVEGLPYLKVETVWAAQHEMAITVDDVLARRTRTVLRKAQGAASVSGEVASMLSAQLGRDEVEMQAEARTFSYDTERDLERAGLPEETEKSAS